MFRVHGALPAVRATLRGSARRGSTDVAWAAGHARASRLEEVGSTSMTRCGRSTRVHPDHGRRRPWAVRGAGHRRRRRRGDDGARRCTKWSARRVDPRRVRPAGARAIADTRRPARPSPGRWPRTSVPVVRHRPGQPVRVHRVQKRPIGLANDPHDRPRSDAVAVAGPRGDARLDATDPPAGHEGHVADECLTAETENQASRFQGTSGPPARHVPVVPATASPPTPAQRRTPPSRPALRPRGSTLLAGSNPRKVSGSSASATATQSARC